MQTRLTPCPLCGEELFHRVEHFNDGSNDLHTAYCHCGFVFSKDCDNEEFIRLCNRRASGWIACSERLPEKNEDGTYSTVRATYKEWDGSLCVTDAVFMNEFDEWFDASDEKQRDLKNVLAWKPQDEPYHGEA